jgi:hypothetical protein
MRRARTLLIAVGAVASLGLLAELAASAAGFTLTQSGSTSGSTVSTTTTTDAAAAAADVDVALLAMGGVAKTIAGPGAFRADVNNEIRVYEVLFGSAPNVCITVRNLAGGEIRVSPSSSSSFDVRGGETRAACVGPAMAIVLSCRDGVRCEGVWRVNRF